MVFLVADGIRSVALRTIFERVDIRPERRFGATLRLGAAQYPSAAFV